MSQPEKKSDHWKLGLIAGGTAIAAGLGYYLGTQCAEYNAICAQENKHSGSSAAHHTDLECPEKCSICLSQLEPMENLSCGHTFHSACIAGWLPENETCPICRQKQE